CQLQAGIVNEIVDAEMLEATALAAVAQLAAKPPEAAALSRAMIRGQPAEVVERIDEEIRIFAERLSSPEAVEAFTAFFDKRAPDFAKLRKSS
ncbi:MAG: enoyl-CoA hydratase-related protein, partial [Pseudomonadota bacterium]